MSAPQGTASKWRYLGASLGLGALAALLALGWTHLVHPELRDDENVSGDFGQVALRRFRSSPLLPQHELIRRRDAYGGAPVWRVPLSDGGRDLIVVGRVAIVRRPSSEHGTPRALEAYAVEDGRALWSIADREAHVGRPRVVQGGALVIESLAGPMLRLRALAPVDGRVVWTTSLAWAPSAGADDSAEELDGTLRMRLGTAIIDVALADGSTRSLAPRGATRVFVCGARVVWREADGRVRTAATSGGEAHDLARAPTGLLTCALRGPRFWLAWASESATGRESGRPRSPSDDVPSDALPGSTIPSDASGALLVFENDGELAWARRFAWGSPAANAGFDDPEGTCSLLVTEPRRPGGAEWLEADERYRARFDCASGEPIRTRAAEP